MANRNIKTSIRDLLFYCYKDTLVPELFDFLGEDLAVEFFKVFGGMNLQVPSYKRALELERNIDIYDTLSLDPAQSTVLRLSERYEITRTRVREIFKTMVIEYPKIARFMEQVDGNHKVKITTKRSPRDVHPETTKKVEHLPKESHAISKKDKSCQRKSPKRAKTP